MTVTPYKWTLDRYHQAIDAGLFDDQPVELLRGDLKLHVFRDLQDGHYMTEDILTGGTVSPLAFQDVSIQVKRLISP